MTMRQCPPCCCHACCSVTYLVRTPCGVFVFMEISNPTTCNPCSSRSPVVRTVRLLASEARICCQKVVSGKMSGVAFLSLSTNRAGGFVEYRFLSELMLAAASDAFHSFVPANALDCI